VLVFGGLAESTGFLLGILPGLYHYLTGVAKVFRVVEGVFKPNQ
jgi:hypothetical protein